MDDAASVPAQRPASPASSSPGMDAVAELEQQLRQGSFFTQASLEQQGQLASRLDAFLTGLIDVLIEDGVVNVERLTEVVNANREQQARDKAAALEGGNGLGAWPTVVVRDEKPDEADEPATPVDCAARMHICKAACCSLRFPLSPSEIEAGAAKWDLGHPYLIRHSDQGYCVHNDRETGGCAIYGQRPKVCRTYSCANDTRIWKDFDNMILNEEYLSSRSPERFHFKPADATALPIVQIRSSPRTAAPAEASG